VNKLSEKQPASFFPVLIEKADSGRKPLKEINYIRVFRSFIHILNSLR